MNRNGNKAESFAGNFVASNGWWQFFEVPICQIGRTRARFWGVFGGRSKRGVESEAAALAVHYHDVGTDFFHQHVVGLLRRRVVGHPRGTPAGRTGRTPRSETAGLRTRHALRRFRSSAQCKQLPGFLLGAEHRLGFEDFGIARPLGTPALDRVRDIDVIAGIKEKVLPAGLGDPTRGQSHFL